MPPTSFRLRLATDALVLGSWLVRSTPIRDFHPKAQAHAGHTHAATIAVAVAEAGRDPARFEGTLPATPEAVRQWVRRRPDASTLLVCYEAGPTGYEMARLLIELGVACQVVVPKKPTDRIKTDRRDAIKLAQALRAGSLTPVRIPTPSEEAFRDLVRARTQAVEDETRARHRIKSALLRWGGRVPAEHRAWTVAYMGWIRQWKRSPASFRHCKPCAASIG